MDWLSLGDGRAVWERNSHVYRGSRRRSSQNVRLLEQLAVLQSLDNVRAL
jgi:hypothetical protein